MTLLRKFWKTFLLVAVFAISVAAPAEAYCRYCKYIWFVGQRCTDAGQGESGWTYCNDSSTCGTAGTPCSAGGSVGCIPEEWTCPENRQ